jgi:integrase
LSHKALDVLRRQKASNDTPTPFPVNANAFRLAWERLRKRADLCDLRFHDLRHEAISRFFELGLSVPEVAVISGHKDARMLFRYTHLKAGNIIAKLG